MGIGRVHLILAAVPKARRTVRRIAEGPIIARRIFDGIAHNRDIDITSFIQRLTDSCYPAIHHIRRRHDIRTSLGLGYRNLLQQFQRFIVVHIMVFQVAAMTM